MYIRTYTQAHTHTHLSPGKRVRERHVRPKYPYSSPRITSSLAPVASTSNLGSNRNVRRTASCASPGSRHTYWSIKPRQNRK